MKFQISIEPIVIRTQYEKASVHQKIRVDVDLSGSELHNLQESPHFTIKEFGEELAKFMTHTMKKARKQSNG